MMKNERKEQILKFSDLEKENRMGKFAITLPLMMDYELSFLEKIFSKMVIIRAETIFNRKIEYVAFSPFFDKIDEGAFIPQYVARIMKKRRNGKGEGYIIMWERLETR